MDNLYNDDNIGTTSAPFGYAEVLARIETIDKALRKTKKKHKHDKHDKKGGKSKKLKRRLRALEMEHEQLKMFLQVFAMQMQTQQKPAWWQCAIVNGLPKLFDMGKVVLNNITQKRPQILPAKTMSQLYLTDGRDK